LCQNINEQIRFFHQMGSMTNKVHQTFFDRGSAPDPVGISRPHSRMGRGIPSPHPLLLDAHGVSTWAQFLLHNSTLTTVCATFNIVVYRYSLYALPPISHPLNGTLDRSSLSFRPSCYGHSGQMFNNNATASFQVSSFLPRDATQSAVMRLHVVCPSVRSVSSLKDWKVDNKQTYKKTEACRLYSRVFWIFLPNVIKIDPYNFELYRFKVCAFFLRHSVVRSTTRYESLDN